MFVQAISQQVIEDSNLITVVRQLPADLETPVSVYLKLAGQGPSFLLESVTGGEQLARYSFIALQPGRAYLLRGNTLECRTPQKTFKQSLPEGIGPLDALREEFSRFRRAAAPGLPRFSGGLVGYLGYEAAHFFEQSVPYIAGDLQDGSDLPDGIFLLADILVAFDHAFGRLVLVANVPLDGDPNQSSSEAERRLDELQQRLAGQLPYQPPPDLSPVSVDLHPNMTRERFIQAVQEAKQHIRAGDIFQVVLSQRFSRRSSASPFDIYRSLRRLNPSPYMFFFDFDNLAGSPPLRLIGGSPEMHVRLEGETAILRPIAGTRRRGQTPAEDQTLEKDLLADPKERAEHVMLVDLARNDLGRVCQFGSISVSELMGVERYSHVMHIVSQVEGRLCPELDGFDLLRATFPAGTVSGAPKIRAMQIISELEQERRGPYAGAVGYFSYDGSLDTCITIRTLVMRGQTISIQSGAGIVADSDPDQEYQETLNKARALAVAVEMAEEAKG
jgi:anthranilate synthase component 1